MPGPTGPSNGGRRPFPEPAQRAQSPAIPKPAAGGTTRLPVAAVTTTLPVAVLPAKPPVAVAIPKQPAATTRLPVPVVTAKLPVAVRSPTDHQRAAVPGGGPPRWLAPRGTPPSGVPAAITTRIPITAHPLPGITGGERAMVTTRLSRAAIDEAVRAAAILAGDRGPPGVPRRYWDDRLGAWIVTVLPGEVYVTDRDEHITTVLGSCVSTCVRHPGTGAGGINHLVLPDTQRTVRTLGCDGLASLDRLIAGVLAYGGRAEELEVKIFGGGRVISGNTGVGRSNVAAVRDYFSDRGLAIAIADVGGGVARRLRYEPHSGRATVQRTVMRETGAPGAS